jgi:hypothetical protein
MIALTIRNQLARSANFAFQALVYNLGVSNGDFVLW